MQTSEKAFAAGHHRSATCQGLAARKEQHATAAQCHEALGRTFTAYGIALKRVEIFPYLGRPVSFVDSDVPAMRRNLKKARGVWGRVSRILRAEYIPPPVCDMFYQAVVMSVF